jgi:hypothetical protein
MRRITDCGLRSNPPAANVALEEPINMDELLQAIKKGKTRKGRAVMGYAWNSLTKRGNSSNETFWLL